MEAALAHAPSLLPLPPMPPMPTSFELAWPQTDADAEELDTEEEKEMDASQPPRVIDVWYHAGWCVAIVDRYPEEGEIVTSDKRVHCGSSELVPRDSDDAHRYQGLEACPSGPLGQAKGVPVKDGWVCKGCGHSVMLTTKRVI